MSAARSPSPSTPATKAGREALVVVAHGDRGGLMTDWLAQEIARRIAGLDRFSDVAVGLLRGTPTLETVSAELGGEALLVYPLFMSNGYYVREAIPERLGVGADGRDSLGRPVHIMAPIGVRPCMTGVITTLARATAEKAGWDHKQASLLLVAHGSTNDPSSREAALAVAGLVEAQGQFSKVDAAFLEEPPLLDDQLAALPGPLIVVGLFIGEGMHGMDDLQTAVGQSDRADIALAEPLARWPDFITAACDDILAAAAMPSGSRR